jgi:hypothetical protein
MLYNWIAPSRRSFYATCAVSDGWRQSVDYLSTGYVNEYLY